MSEADALIDGMDWGPGSVTEGTAEADDAKNALISAVLTQDGSGAAKGGESEASRLWRCGKLRNTEPDAAFVLRRAMRDGDQQRDSRAWLTSVVKRTGPILSVRID